MKKDYCKCSDTKILSENEYKIISDSGMFMGIYNTNSPEHALNIMAQKIGYNDYKQMCNALEYTGCGHWIGTRYFRSGNMVVECLMLDGIISNNQISE